VVNRGKKSRLSIQDRRRKKLLLKTKKLLFRTRAFHLRPKNCTFNVPQRFRDRLAIFLVTVCGRSICYYFGTASNRERPTLIDRPNSMLAYFFHFTLRPFLLHFTLSRVVRRRLGVDVMASSLSPFAQRLLGALSQLGPNQNPYVFLSDQLNAQLLPTLPTSAAKQLYFLAALFGL
jgi:hypothetical protein